MHRPASCRAIILSGGDHFAIRILEISSITHIIRRDFRDDDYSGGSSADRSAFAVSEYSGESSHASLGSPVVYGLILCRKDNRKTRKGAWHPHRNRLRNSHVCGTDECMQRHGCCDFLTNPNTLLGDFTMCRIGRHSWCEHQNYQTTLLKNP